MQLLWILTLIVFGCLQVDVKANTIPHGDRGYVYTPGIGYHKLHSFAETWDDARLICQADGGDLAVVNSKLESEIIAQLLRLSPSHYGSEDSDYAHVGFNDRGIEGQYVTIENQTLAEAGFGEWEPDEPSNGGEEGNEDCGSISNCGRLNDIDCSQKAVFVCERPQSEEEKSKVLPVAAVGYVYTPGIGHHKIYSLAKTWAQAQEICKADGGDLAVIDSKLESEVIVQLFKSSLPHCDSEDQDVAHIGFHDQVIEGQYVTIRNETLAEAGFGEWELDEPSNGGEDGNEDCGSVSNCGRLNDINCTQKAAFVCERPQSAEEKAKDLPVTTVGYVYTPGIGHHKVHSIAETWNQSRSICQAEGGDLTVVNSKVESEVIAQLFKLSRPHCDSEDSDYAHIGFHDQVIEGQYVTIENQTLAEAGFGEWEPDEPSNAGEGGEDCGSISSCGRLNDIDCSQKAVFVCERPQSEEEKLQAQTFVDLGYVYTPGIGRHKIHTLAQTWDEAQEICKTEGGNLAVINSKPESEVITKLFELSLPHCDSEDSDYAHIGFNDRSIEGQYVTIGAQTLAEAGFDEWAENEPGDDEQPEDCGSVYKDGLLNDISCNATIAFVCERPL